MRFASPHYRVIFSDSVKNFCHALQFCSGANSRVFADASLVKAGRAVALVQHLLVGGLEQTVGHFVPKIRQFFISIGTHNLMVMSFLIFYL